MPPRKVTIFVRNYDNHELRRAKTEVAINLMFARVRRRLEFVRKEYTSPSAEFRRSPQDMEYLQLELQYLQQLLKDVRRKWSLIVKTDVWQSLSEDTILKVRSETMGGDDGKISPRATGKAAVSKIAAGKEPEGRKVKVGGGGIRTPIKERK